MYNPVSSVLKFFLTVLTTLPHGIQPLGTCFPNLLLDVLIDTAITLVVEVQPGVEVQVFHAALVNSSETVLNSL